MDGTFLKNLKKNSSSVYIHVYIVHINQCSELSELLDLELWRSGENLRYCSNCQSAVLCSSFLSLVSIKIPVAVLQLEGKTLLGCVLQ